MGYVWLLVAYTTGMNYYGIAKMSVGPMQVVIDAL